jgi:hypothetical protein
MKLLLNTSATFFLIVFSAIFILTVKTPKSIENSAKSFIKKQIESEVVELIIKKNISLSVSHTLNIGEKVGLKIDDTKFKKQVKKELPKLIETVVSYKLTENLKKNGFKKLAKSSSSFVSKFKVGERKLDLLIEEKYDEIKKNLKNDIRIFSGINAFLFFLLILLSAKNQNSKGIILPGFLLFTSTIISSIIYIFGQDWVYVMMYNSYLGFGYLAYVAIILYFLFDIAYNKGEVTIQILEIITDILKGIGDFINIFSGI